MSAKKAGTAAKEKGFTPMMQQYLDVKEDNRDSILMYRLGDFYEMFFDDAKTVSRELDLVLTGRARSSWPQSRPVSTRSSSRETVLASSKNIS